MVEWREEMVDTTCPVTDRDVFFCMSIGTGTFGGVKPLQLPAFSITDSGKGVVVSEEKPSETESAFRAECEKYGVHDYKLLRACMLFVSPQSVRDKDDLWLATLSNIGFYMNINDWARDRVLDFNEDDILCESKIKLKDGGYKTFRVRDINAKWLEWLGSHQSFSECAKVLDIMFEYMSRFKVLPVCMRLVQDAHVQHAYSMKRWYADAR